MMSALKMTALRIAHGRLKVHDVERGDLRECPEQHRRNDGEIFRDVVRDAEGGERAAGDEKLLPDLDDLDQLRRIRIEIDHVAGFLGGLRAGVHRHADIGLRERRRVVRSVARSLPPSGRRFVLCG